MLCALRNHNREAPCTGARAIVSFQWLIIGPIPGRKIFCSSLIYSKFVFLLPLLPCFVTSKKVFRFSSLWSGTSWDSLSSTMGRSNATPARCMIAGLNTLHTPILGCCYITVDSATTALQNGACTYKCISKQMHYKMPFSHNGYMQSLEFYEYYITLFCLEKNKLFDNIIFTKNHAWHLTQSGWINYLV